MPRASAPPSHATGGPAPDPDTGRIRHDAIVGHRLAGGYMSVHAPGQPCKLCEGARSIPHSWRLAATMSPAGER